MMIIVLPVLDDMYKLLAVAVALYFPVAMLTLIAIDKLHKTREDSPLAPLQHTSGAMGNSPSAAARSGSAKGRRSGIAGLPVLSQRKFSLSHDRESAA